MKNKDMHHGAAIRASSYFGSKLPEQRTILKEGIYTDYTTYTKGLAEDLRFPMAAKAPNGQKVYVVQTAKRNSFDVSRARRWVSENLRAAGFLSTADKTGFDYLPV